MNETHAMPDSECQCRRNAQYNAQNQPLPRIAFCVSLPNNIHTHYSYTTHKTPTLNVDTGRIRPTLITPSVRYTDNLLIRPQSLEVGRHIFYNYYYFLEINIYSCLFLTIKKGNRNFKT